MLEALAVGTLGAVASALGQRSANKQAQSQAVEQMSFQERMANTTYQRGTTDMKAAGLNPMLAYMQGGAPSPQGAAAPVQNIMADVPKHISSAIDSMRLKNETTQAQAQLELTQNSAKNTKEQTIKLNAETKHIKDLNKDFLQGEKARSSQRQYQGNQDDMNNATRYIDKAGGYLKETKDFFTPKFKTVPERNDNSARPKSKFKIDLESKAGEEYFNPRTKKWTKV